MQPTGFTALLLLFQALSPLQQNPTPPSLKLVIADITVGAGDPVVMGDELKLDYTGTFADGKVFDSSKKPGGRPLDIILGFNPLIQGWTQGLLGMKAGGVRKLTVPPDLGYGKAGRPPVIPPNATLVFTISLAQVSHPVKLLKIATFHPGEGPQLTWGDVGIVKLTGKTSDGAVFLSTREERPGGVRFALGSTPHAPPGFYLGLIGMKRGEQRTITIPPELGFGPGGQPALNIKPNETLTLDVELVSIGESPGPTRNKDPRE